MENRPADDRIPTGHLSVAPSFGQPARNLAGAEVTHGGGKRQRVAPEEPLLPADEEIPATSVTTRNPTTIAATPAPLPGAAPGLVAGSARPPFVIAPPEACASPCANSSGGSDFRRRRRQGPAKHGPFARAALGPDPAAVASDDAVNRGQADVLALELAGGVQARETAGRGCSPRRGVEARAVVLDEERRSFVRGPSLPISIRGAVRAAVNFQALPIRFSSAIRNNLASAVEHHRGLDDDGDVALRDRAAAAPRRCCARAR